MAAVTICSDLGAQKNKVWHCFPCFIFVFWMLSFKPTFSLSTFTFIKRLFSSSSLSAIRVAFAKTGNMSESEVAQSCPTLCNPMDCSQPTTLLCPWDFPGNSTGVDCQRRVNGSNCKWLCFFLRWRKWSKLDHSDNWTSLHMVNSKNYYMYFKWVNFMACDLSLKKYVKNNYNYLYCSVQFCKHEEEEK